MYAAWSAVGVAPRRPTQADVKSAGQLALLGNLSCKGLDLSFPVEQGL